MRLENQEVDRILHGFFSLSIIMLNIYNVGFKAKPCLMNGSEL